MKEILAAEFKRLQGGIVATPESREDLEAFAKANHGSMDILLMQMAIQYGYKIALENVLEEVMNKEMEVGV
jgi:hypothetical protein